MANIYVSSGTSFSATISITYPAGSTCTVANYKKTWTAPNTSGSWTFKANEVGVYTVKAVSGSKSREKEVLITAEGQSKTITIVYETVLFDATDNTSITGGWQQKNYFDGYGTASISNGLIQVVGSTAYGGASASYMVMYLTKNKIDLTEATSLKAQTGTINGNNLAFVIKSANTLSGWYDDPLTDGTCPAYTKLTANGSSNSTVSIDVSDITGQYYIGAIVCGDSAFRASRIWFE